MKCIGVIPARYSSTRLPGKSLVPILGKPLLQWVIEGVQKSKELDDVLVATDHEDIKKLAKSLDVMVEMTDSDLPSGSDRIWAAVKNKDVDLIINIQGDEPLVNGEVIDSLINAMKSDSQPEMGTLITKLSKEELEDPNSVKVIKNNNNEAIYFSRFPIPFSRENMEFSDQVCYKHIGMYAYTKDFLKRFCSESPCEIEKAEALEQLRALYLGAKIHTVYTDHDLIGVDVEDDIKKVEKYLKK